jgi:hypothetical protein
MVMAWTTRLQPRAPPTSASIEEDTPAPRYRRCCGCTGDGAVGLAATSIRRGDHRQQRAPGFDASGQVKAPADAAWTDVPTSGLGTSSAWVVPANDLLRFNPVMNWSARRSYRPRGRCTATVAATPQTVNIGSLAGGTNPWSTGSATVGITVTAANDAPTLSGLTTRTINEDVEHRHAEPRPSSTPTAGVALRHLPPAATRTLAPDSAIVLGGSGFNRTVRVTPAANAFGTATISLTVTEVTAQQQSTTSTFDVVVNPVNDAPLAVADVWPRPSTRTCRRAGTSCPRPASDSDATDSSEATALTAVAVVGNSANSSTQGCGSTRPHSGVNWSNIATGLSNSSALVLPADYRVRFVPALNFNGILPAGAMLSVRLADGSMGPIAFSASTSLQWPDRQHLSLVFIHDQARHHRQFRERPAEHRGHRQPDHRRRHHLGCRQLHGVGRGGPEQHGLHGLEQQHCHRGGHAQPHWQRLGVTISGSRWHPARSRSGRRPTSTTVDNAGNPVTITVTWLDGSSASASTSFNVTVNATNDAPVGGNVTVASISEDIAPAANPGTALSALYVGAAFSDAADAPSVRGTFAGVAIVGNTSTAAQGEWQTSTDGGSTWTNVRRTSIDDTNAIVLSSTALVRFSPASNFNGAPGALTVRVAESAVTALPTGNNVALGATGGASRWANATTTIGMAGGGVSALNDAATLVGGVTPTLASVSEEEPNPPGATVASLFAAAYSDAADTVTGGSTGTALSAVAVVGNTTPATQGVWQWSADGSSWTTIALTDVSSGVSDTRALVLPTDHLLRFLPAANFHGTPTALQVRLGDGGVGIESLNTSKDISASVGGTGRWSAATLGLSAGVNPVNDAPVVVAAEASAYVVAEDTANPAAQTVSAIFGAAAVYSDATDGSAATALGAVAIIGNNATASQGAWQYRANASAAWTAVPTAGLSSTTALVLPASYQLRFLPAANFNNDAGVAGSLTVRLGDQSRASAIDFSASRNLTVSAGGSIGGTGCGPPMSRAWAPA